MEESTLKKEIQKLKLETTDPKITKFSDLKGSNIVLYFYPKDNTPGCTTEAQDFKAMNHAFKKANTVVLGVSRDSVESHHRFKEKYQLPFELISDHNEDLCTLFDVIKPKIMFGKKVRGIERSTFLLDATGNLKHVWSKVKVKEHVQEVLKTAQHLGK